MQENCAKFIISNSKFHVKNAIILKLVSFPKIFFGKKSCVLAEKRILLRCSDQYANNRNNNIDQTLIQNAKTTQVLLLSILSTYSKNSFYLANNMDFIFWDLLALDMGLPHAKWSSLCTFH